MEIEKTKQQDIYDKFNYCADLHQQSWKYLNDQNVYEYINESVARANGNTPNRDVKDWQANVRMPKTMNKILAILSFMAAQRPRVDIIIRNMKSIFDREIRDEELSVILTGLNDYEADIDDTDFKFVLASFEALVKGTVFVEEGWAYEVKEKKLLTSTLIFVQANQIPSLQLTIIASGCTSEPSAQR